MVRKRLGRRAFGIGLVVVFLSTLGIVSSATRVWATTTVINVGADQARCNTVVGALTFSPPLHTSGNAGAETVTLKGSDSGCTDLTNGAVQTFTGSFLGAATFNAGSACSSYLPPAGPSTQIVLAATGAWTLTWKPAKGQDFSPKTGLRNTSATSLQTFVTVDPRSVFGGFGGTNGAYSALSIGGGYDTGDEFAGNNANTALQVILANDYKQILAACGSKAGLKTLTIGLGETDAGY